MLRGLLKVQLLDALANAIDRSYIDQTSYGARLIEQIQPLLEQSLGKGQIEFYKAIAENAVNARARLLAAAFRHAEMVKQLQTEMGSNLFDPPPDVAGARHFPLWGDAFSESIIWAGADACTDACDRLAAVNTAANTPTNVDAKLLQDAQRAVMEQAAKWLELASRFEGSLTTEFIKRGLAIANGWFGTHAQNGNLTSDFRKDTLQLMSAIGHVLCESEIWERDYGNQIFYWKQGIDAWARQEGAAETVKAAAMFGRWDLYNESAGLAEDLNLKGLRTAPGSLSMEKPVWTSPTDHADIFEKRPLLRVLAENDWDLNYICADIFGAILLRRAPSLAALVPESSERLRELMDQAEIEQAD